MSLNKLLARFSIQTKVIIFILPLIVAMIGLAAVNLYTGSMLGDRLVGTNASIETLSGFKKTYAKMTEFLQEQNEEKREAVVQSLNEQLLRLDKMQALAENEQELNALSKSRTLAEELHNDVDSLWAVHGEELEVRTSFQEVIIEIENIRKRLNIAIDTIASELAASEEAAKDLLVSADVLAVSAKSIGKITNAISGNGTPEDVFAIANGLKDSIGALKTDLSNAIPKNKPALKNDITYNIDGILKTLDKGVIGKATKIKLQKYAKALRSARIKLNGLASQVSRQATTNFLELEEPILVGKQTNVDARNFLSDNAALQLSIVEFLGQPDQALGERLAGSLSSVQQSIELIEFSDGSEILMQAIGDKLIDHLSSLPALTTNLIAKEETASELFVNASNRINNAWSGIINFASSQQDNTVVVKDRANGITLSAATVGTIFGLLAAFMLIHALKGPIRRLVRAMRDVANGDLDVDVTDNTRADEIGEMARALDVFKVNAVDKIRVENESEHARGLANQEREKSETEKAEADSQVRFAVQSLGQALRNLSQGDLVSTIKTPFNGELDTLRLDFNESVAKMGDALGQIRSNTTAIQENGDQMKSSADDLAQRTEHQAASLEETAAAIDQVSAAVRASSDRAAEVEKLTNETTQAARESGEVVGRAVNSMSRIEEASGKINQIISVIDEIAFQTNLLALNAGVEAARAGEAGRGFAVVAQEVRELAGRSANAAKEIKELIDHSGKEVHQGVTHVGETGDAITRIISNVEKISENISSMARASNEQATGLGEVNSAINQMDQVTQKNATMVEETNSSSHTLAQEAESLTKLVAAFRLDDEHVHSSKQNAAA
ncbi:methyl-accepting chemotaxis protein [Lentilitoribacter sp. EG35]|uniref:methyl-accepting chemotaxis protein n=1 Tax=Lentilitoribacter sp. EG35 TaxID=3234192 RepID=UPI0034600499